MTRTNYIRAAAGAAGLMVLIFDSRCALEGARYGLDLCIKTAIPSLFPFFILSMMLTGSLTFSNSMLLKRLAALLHIPQQAAAILIPAFLGGYPIGAKCVTDLYRNGLIEKEQAERMLGFCSNAGPSFLFGMVSAFFPDKRMVWTLWCIHILSAVLTGLLLPGRMREANRCICKNESLHSEQDIMMSAIKAMAAVCGWIVVMRTLLQFLNVWLLWMLPQWMQVAVIGFLELSNGCCELLRLENVAHRFIVCSCMLAFGGVSVLLQTMSVTKGLSLRNYVAGKVLQTVFSLILSCIFAAENRLIYIFAAALFPLLIIKIKNIGRNPDCYPV